MDVEVDIEPITQESQPTNKDITDMDLEAEHRKRKDRPTSKANNATTVITPTHSSIQQAKIQN